jgi:hypothetical protein
MGPTNATPTSTTLTTAAPAYYTKAPKYYKLGSAKKVHRKGKNIPFFFLSC